MLSFNSPRNCVWFTDNKSDVFSPELGVLHWVIDADNYEQDPLLEKIKKDRGYTYQVSYNIDCAWAPSTIH